MAEITVEELLYCFTVGISGSILINEQADRLNSYNIWNYAEGHDSYYSSILVDLTQPPDKVRDLASIYLLSQ